MLKLWQIVLVFGFLLLFPLSSFSEDNTGVSLEKGEPVAAIDDRVLPLSDKEVLLQTRLEDSALSGDFPLMLSYYSSLMLSFISKDEQANILEYSSQLFPKLFVYRDYAFAQDLLTHLQFRLNYYSQESQTIKEKRKEILDLYQIILYLLPKGTLFQKFPDGFNREAIENEVSSKNTSSNLLRHLILGLTEKPDQLENAFQELYLALNMANSSQNLEMYYTISTILIRGYVNNKLYDSALTRLNFLYRLFSTNKFSDYYRIKVLIYFSQVYLLDNKIDEAYTVYIRVKDILKYNDVISGQEVIQLNKLLSWLTPKFSNYVKEKGLENRSNFLNSFLDSPDNSM